KEQFRLYPFTLRDHRPNCRLDHIDAQIERRKSNLVIALPGKALSEMSHDVIACRPHNGGRIGESERAAMLGMDQDVSIARKLVDGVTVGPIQVDERPFAGGLNLG